MSDGRPVLIDFFSCQGGAAYGYAQAGFRVIMSDIVRPRRMPPGIEFVQGDATDPRFFRELVAAHRPAVVTGSPPCQAYSDCQRIQKRDHPELIKPFRELCQLSGLPCVIENVEGARAELIDPVMLCGTMFPGLRTYRHRLFESSVPLWTPDHGSHEHLAVKMGRPLEPGQWYHAVGNFSNVPYVRENMGVPWMTRDGIRECIPPAYTEFIGRQLMSSLTTE